MMRTEAGLLAGAPAGVAWRGVGWRVLAAAACVAPALPLLATDLPPLADYPNHLARMLFLGTQTDDPAMARMLAPNWALLPNLGADAVLPWLMRVAPATAVGRGLLAVLLVLPVLGCVALSRATYGRAAPWALGAALVACNGLFLLGFLNFSLGVGLAMPAAAAWFRWRERWPAAIAAGAGVAACLLFFCHLLGVAFFALLIGAYEAERCLALRGRGMVRRGLVLAGVLAGPVALYWATALRGAGGPVIWAGWPGKAVLALYPVVNYVFWLDVATAAAVLLVLGAALAGGRVQVAVRWRIVLAVLAVLFVVSPVIGKGLAYVDTRFAIMLAFAVFAGVRPIRVPWGAGVAVGAGFGLLLAGRTAVVGAMWHEHAGIVAQVRGVIAPVEPGARVLPAWGGRAAAPSPRVLSDGTMMDWHLPALVMLERRAFWPYLFANPAQQPVHWIGDYAALSVETPGQVLWPYLSGAPLAGAEAAEFPLWRSWAARYDYVLLMAPDPGMDLDAVGGGRLVRLATSDAAVLYRVVRAPGSAR